MVQGGVSFPWLMDLAISCTSLYLTEQRPAPGWDNLHVGAVSHDRLDSLSTSNGLLKINKKHCRSKWIPPHSGQCD